MEPGAHMLRQRSRSVEGLRQAARQSFQSLRRARLARGDQISGSALAPVNPDRHPFPPPSLLPCSGYPPPRLETKSVHRVVSHVQVARSGRLVGLALDLCEPLGDVVVVVVAGRSVQSVGPPESDAAACLRHGGPRSLGSSSQSLCGNLTFDRKLLVLTVWRCESS
jgi:hypothetical protein